MIFDQLIALKGQNGMGQPEGGAPDLGDLVDAVVNLGHLKAKEHALALTERRIVLLEAKAKALDDAAKEIGSAGGITAETLRKIEEASKLL
jgi:hypothetical protein